MDEPKRTWPAELSPASLDAGNAGQNDAMLDASGRPMRRMRRSGKPLHPSITSEQISDVVDTFYGKVQAHPRLAGLFAEGMSQDWPDHLEHMKGFWRSMLLQTREYAGRPVPAHMKMSKLKPDDFATWLGLFRETVFDICPKDAADIYINRAETIARTLQSAMFFTGQLVPHDAFENGILTPHWANKLPLN